MNTADAFKLIVENERLIVSMIHQCARGATQEEIEDVHSAVKIELCERLVRDFDPTKSKASTYMAMVARSRASDMIRGRKYHAAFDTGEDDSEESYSYSRELAAPDTGISSFEAREEIKLALSEIDGKLGGAAFALDCFAGEMDTEEIAAKYGVDPNTVYSRRNKIRKFLEKRLSR